MALDFDLSYLAKLSELELSEQERESLSQDLSRLLSYIESIEEVDIEGVQPSAHAEAVLAPLRSDEPQPSQSPEQALRNAPRQSGGQIAVPRVVQDD